MVDAVEVVDVVEVVEVVGSGGGGSDVGGLGGELAADGGDVGEPACASALVEAELQWQVGDREECELLGGGLLSLTSGHTGIIAKGCDTVGR